MCPLTQRRTRSAQSVHWRDDVEVFIEIRQVGGLRRDRDRSCLSRRSWRARLRRCPGYSGRPGRPCPTPTPARRSRPGAPWQARPRWRRYGHGRSRPGGPGAAGAGADRHRRSFRGRCARGWDRLLAALAAHRLRAVRQPAAGLRDPSSTSGSPSSNSPQHHLPASANPRSDLGRVNGGAGQVHLTNLEPTPTAPWTSLDRRAGGCQRLCRRLDCDRLRRLCQRPGQLHTRVRHHPAELGEQVRHRRCPSGHPGPRRRWSAAARGASGLVNRSPSSTTSRSTHSFAASR